MSNSLISVYEKHSKYKRLPHQRKEPAKLKQGNNNLFNERVTLQKIMRPTGNARTSHDARLLRNSAFMHFYTSPRFR